MAHGGTPAPNPIASRRRPGARRFELLTLGDELLLGLTANAHLTWIGQQLGRRGVQLARNVTVTDEAVAIVAELRESWARADVVITTGGLGPTCDDRTREAVAEVLGQKLVFDPAIKQAIADRFARLGRKMTPNNLKQAYRFERGEVLPNANGTAPGLWVEQGGKVLVMLPGPPERAAADVHRTGAAAAREARAASARARPTCSSAPPAWASPRSRPSCSPSSTAPARRSAWHTAPTSGASTCASARPTGHLSLPELQAIAEECAALLGEDFVCYGHDSLAKVVADLFRAQEKTLAVAESCTGGLLANLFTDVCGASKFFRGAIVCYSNDAKMQILDVPECLHRAARRGERRVRGGAGHQCGRDAGGGLRPRHHRIRRAHAAAPRTIPSARSTSACIRRRAFGRRN